jgi:hypothetical protein
MIGLLASVLGVACALVSSLLPFPSIATFQFARAIQTNMLVRTHTRREPPTPLERTLPTL